MTGGPCLRYITIKWQIPFQNLEDVVKGWQKHEQENKMASESLSLTIRR